MQVLPHLQNLLVYTIQNLFCKIFFKLRTTPVYAEVTNPSLSPPHSWPDSPLDSITHISDDTWTPNVDFARRHIFSANINLPDGRITDFQKVTSKEINSVDVCIFRAKFLICFHRIFEFSEVLISFYHFFRFGWIFTIIH